MELELQRISPRGASIHWWRAPAKHSNPALGAVERPASSLAFNALVAFTFVLLVAPQEHFSWLNPLHLAVVTSVLAAVALLRDRSRRGPRMFSSGPAVTLALALAAWSLATIPFSLWPGGSVGLFTSIYFKSITIFLLLGAIVDSTVKLRKLAWALTLCVVPIALTALLNFASHKFIGGEQAVERIVGYQSGLGKNPNDLALLLNLILPISCGLFLAHRGLGGRLFLAFAIVLDAGAIVATFSRAGFLTLALTFVCLGWKLRKRNERVFIFIAFALAGFCLLLLPAGYLGHLGTITNIAADATGSAQERSRDMLQALGEILHRPIFGAGLGMNVLALNADRGATWRMVHNVYLQYATDLGLPGLALFLAVFASCLSGLAKSLKRLRTDPDRRELFDLAQGVQLSLFGFALAGFFHPVGYHFPFFYLAGLAVAVRGITLGRT